MAELGRPKIELHSDDPDVALVGFDFDGEYFYFGGHIITRTHKYKNILENPKVSFVIDDLQPLKPWTPRMLKIRGASIEFSVSGSRSTKSPWSPLHGSVGRGACPER